MGGVYGLELLILRGRRGAANCRFVVVDFQVEIRCFEKVILVNMALLCGWESGVYRL